MTIKEIIHRWIQSQPIGTLIYTKTVWEDLFKGGVFRGSIYNTFGQLKAEGIIERRANYAWEIMSHKDLLEKPKAKRGRPVSSSPERKAEWRKTTSHKWSEADLALMDRLISVGFGTNRSGCIREALWMAEKKLKADGVLV